MASENKLKVSPDGERSEPVTFKKDGREMVQKDRVADAVRRMLPRAPINNARGLFHHPQEFTEEEIKFTVDCLKQNIPVYVIAGMLQCERHTLSRLINSMPELVELKDAKYQNLVEQAEYQADRLVQGGNATMIMYVLDRLGGAKWNPQMEGEGEGGSGEGDRIVMGLIPDEEVRAAEEKVRELAGKEGLPPPATNLPSPMELSMMQDAVKEEVSKQMEAARPEVVDVGEDANVSPPPYGAENYADYGQPPVGGMTDGADPWADGGNSPFFQ